MSSRSNSDSKTHRGRTSTARAAESVCNQPAGKRAIEDNVLYLQEDFALQIKDGSHEGFIFNQLDPNMLKESNSDWADEDYVLVWVK